MRHVLVYAVALLIARNAANGNSRDKLQCKDENNMPVDWYVLYKLPKLQTSSNPLIRKGLAYLYITDATVGTGWQLSARSIASNSSIPGSTLAPLYNDENDEENLWALYNDSPPDAPSIGSYGHAKGVAVVNSGQGFWLIHSVPSFPPAPKAGDLTRPPKNGHVNITGRYDYPQSGTLYGQSFLCVSLDGDQFNTVGKQLMYNEIIVYAKNIPDTLATKYPLLRNATNQKRIKLPPYDDKAVIKSLRSVEFTSFAKGGKWQRELYADFVGPQLQTDLYVQSWQNGPGKLPSICTDRKIYNVKSLIFGAASVDYANTHDHSKWAVSVTNRTSTHWVCIADINRASTQYSRGGGALCFKQPQLWTHYRNVVNDVERCSRA
ncbi:deoxyribonuclease II [Andrena cerasifolii]|uniref:deoxyribonuclease II n=1 Tax=Andrena cerasifolii TaxID=2819439 RepID=UPI00403792FE